MELDKKTGMELGHQCAPDKWILLPEKVGSCGVATLTCHINSVPPRTAGTQTGILDAGRVAYMFPK